jgi:hypothetical protein
MLGQDAVRVTALSIIRKDLNLPDFGASPDMGHSPLPSLCLSRRVAVKAVPPQRGQVWIDFKLLGDLLIVAVVRSIG